MTIKDLVTYLLFVVPGFVTVEIYRARYPAKKDSDFARLGWSIVYSVLILGLAKWAAHLLQSDLSFDSDSLPNFRAVFWLFIMAALLGLIRIAFHKIRFEFADHFESLSFLYPDPLSTWAFVNSELPQQWALVVLKDGTRYLGWIGNWTFDPDGSDNDFLLQGAKCVDISLATLYEVDGRGVYLRGNSVDRIEFWKGEGR